MSYLGRRPNICIFVTLTSESQKPIKQFTSMKRIIIILIGAITIFSTDFFAQEITVPELPSLANAEIGVTKCQVENAICPDSIIQFKDEGLKFYCLHSADRNRDGEISYNEAAMANQINCEYGGRRALRYIQSYDDLVYFVNIEKLFLGLSNIKELDLSANKKLKLININALDELETLILHEGCNPEIVMPLSKADSGVTIIHK